MATAHYKQVVYGVDEQQSLASGHPVFNFNSSGTTDAGVGFSATKFVGSHFLINLDAAISQVRGRASRSPLVEQRTQRVLAVSFEYHWESGSNANTCRSTLALFRGGRLRQELTAVLILGQARIHERQNGPPRGSTACPAPRQCRSGFARLAEVECE